MSKIVCDVCGAAYPETSSRCPVCGSVHYGTPEPVDGTTVAPRKEREPRSSGESRSAKTNNQKRKKQSKKNNPMIKYIAVGAALIVLLVILIAMLMTSCEGGNAPTEPPATTVPPTEAPIEIPCTGITLSVENVSLTELGQSVRLTAICTPEDTTDTVSFVSDNPAVATVNEVGQIVAVSSGTARITVTCGEVSAVCEVVCTIVEETEPPTLPPETLILNRTDLTLFYKGDTWQLYSGQIDKSLITFTSDNDAIVTFVDGRVTAVSQGRTTVYAEYGDQKISCIVRCSFRDDTTSGGNGGVEEDNGNSGSGAYSIWTTYGKDPDHDATISVGEDMLLYLKDASNNKHTIEWTASAEGIVSIDGQLITGAAPGRVILTGTYEDVEYKFTVRVKPAN